MEPAPPIQKPTLFKTHTHAQGAREISSNVGTLVSNHLWITKPTMVPQSRKNKDKVIRETLNHTFPFTTLSIFRMSITPNKLN